MRNLGWPLAAALALGLAGCGSGGGDEAGTNASANESASGAAAGESAQASPAAAPAGFQGCPFQATTDWIGSWEVGHVRVNGRVDLQMAGFRPALTERADSGGGTLRLDLALVPEPNAAVSDAVRHERTGTPLYRRAEIWCGGERIESFDMVVVE